MEILNSEEVMPTTKGFSSAIVDLRTEQGLSRAQLAVYADIGIGALERVEQCKQPPSLKTLLCISEVLDVSLDDIVEKAHDADQ